MTTTDLCRPAIAVRRRQPIWYSTTRAAPIDVTSVDDVGERFQVELRDADGSRTAHVIYGLRRRPAYAGIAAGPVVLQDGDYFSRTVNLAARIGGAAAAGQTLVSEPVVELADGSGLTFREADPLELKGAGEPVRVFEAGPSGSAALRER